MVENFPPAQAPPAPISPKRDLRIWVVAGILLVIAGLVAAIAVLNKMGSTSARKDIAKSAPTASPYPTINPKVTCARFKDLSYALQNIKVACWLDLSDKNLDSIPQDVLKLTNLTQITLSKNNIKEFPKELTNISKLIEIDLSNNQISTISASISKFSNLQKLDLSNNKLSGLPPEVSQLKQLNYLILKDNNISSSEQKKIQKMLIKPTGFPLVKIEF